MTRIASFLASHGEIGWLLAALSSVTIATLLWMRRQARLARIAEEQEATRLEFLFAVPARWAEGEPPEKVRRQVESADVADAAEAIASLAARLIDAAAAGRSEESPSKDEPPRQQRKPTLH